MEKFFLQHGWSDGLPLTPPTEEAVSRILEGCELPREHVVSVFPPGMGKATVEKIAINAVMAGCLPQYMPVIMAAVETVIDPAFDLVGAQNTSGQIAPLFILSGQKLCGRAKCKQRLLRRRAGLESQYHHRPGIKTDIDEYRPFLAGRE